MILVNIMISAFIFIQDFQCNLLTYLIKFYLLKLGLLNLKIYQCFSQYLGLVTLFYSSFFINLDSVNELMLLIIVFYFMFFLILNLEQ